MFSLGDHDRDKFYSRTGSASVSKYAIKFDKNGVEKLERVGEEPLFEKIQAAADSVDFKKMLDRFMQGDLTAFEKAQGFYADLDGIPGNLMDVMNKGKEAEVFFHSMPLSVRSDYGHNVGAFLNDLLSGEFSKKYSKPVADPVVYKPEEKKEGGTNE